ncbi:hypothetical protein BRARA_E01747 [Brassica rapa]|uniref:Uncharacterized protein n=1 Tax=Brassica campestris TaxID=3711 RepID=A0A397ZB74_BRACM|nr:hypothetical protein BRARA_E01747 [Brassica rapa]
MESGSVSSIDQALPTSGDEKDKFTVYSTAVHKVVFMINVVVLGLLLHLTCFSLLVFFYAVFRVREAIDVNRRFGVIARLVGRTSHLLGGLAASVLISVVSTELAFVLLIL